MKFPNNKNADDFNHYRMNDQKQDEKLHKLSEFVKLYFTSE